jgi:hypothetical protein
LFLIQFVEFSPDLFFSWKYRAKVIAQTLVTFTLITATLFQGLAGSHRNVNGPSGRMDNVLTGMWGGQHIRLEVSSSGASIEYDCAHGTIDQPMTLDSKGYFDVRGTHVTERAGPVREGERSDALAARYTGRIQGETMIITVVLSDSRENAGTFTLGYGKTPRLRKCL